MNKLLLGAFFLLIGAEFWAGEETIEMSVATVTISPPMVILRGEEKAILPIAIGTAEARAIALALNKVGVPRPMTHDLLSSLVEKLGARVGKVFIHDLRNGTLFAQIVLIKNGERLILDSRPSDAIALALRTDSPIIVAEKLVTRIIIPEVEEEEEEEEGIWI